jgi:tripartite-type tricarboxylate transporter receptor subunit TctC
LRVVLALPEVKQRFDALSVSMRSMSPRELSEFIHSERQLWKPVVQQANLGTQ